MPDALICDLITDGIAFPESPRWRDGLLWFSDVHNYRLRACDGTGRLVRDIAVPGRPAGLGFLPDGDLLMATGQGKRLYRISPCNGNCAPDLVCDLSLSCSGLLNDMVVDAKGCAYVGDTGFNPATGEDYRTGQILLVRPGHDARAVAQDIHFPNGMVITPDGATLIVAESGARRISAFTIRADGSLEDYRTLCKVDAIPDGIALDTDGSLWIGDYAGGRFIRVGKGGQLQIEITAEATHAIACGWGGEDRSTLYLCAATRQASGDYAGTIRTMKAPRPGAGWPA